jgi:hypothetical protein
MKQIGTWTLAAVAAVMLASPVSAQSKATLEELKVAAAKANTPSQHAAVAKQYRLQSEAFEAQAVEFEKSAKRGVEIMGAQAHKWPGMIPQGVQNDKAKAVEARRAAKETKQLADQHIRLAVEAQAGSIAAAD